MKQIFDWLREQLEKLACWSDDYKNVYIDRVDVLEVINEAEAKWEADFVRCKDCKFQQCNIYTEGYYCGRGVFPNNRNYVTEDDFCSLAEKR